MAKLGNMSMFDTISSFKCTRLGRKSRLVAPLAIVPLVMAFVLSVTLPGVILVSGAQAKKLSKSQKKALSKKAKRLRKARRLKRNSGAPRNSGIQSSFKQKLNQNTVTLMSGCCTTGAYTAFGADIKDMVRMAGDKNGLRVLPMLGGGAGTNVRDILYLRGVDMAILNTDVIDYYKNKPLYENLTKRVQYITKLFNEEVHLYAGKGVTSLHDLEGKVVGYNNSNAEVTGSILFKKLGITPKQTMRISEGDGALALREGKLDAMMRVTGKPINSIGRMKAIFPQIKLLPISYDPAFIGSHLPTQLTHEDYPDLIDQGQVVPTIATRTILAVFNWKPGTERYRRLMKFTNTFFGNYSTLRHSRNLHPKWTEVNLQATVPGMTRFGPAVKWLNDKNPVVKDLNTVASKAPVTSSKEDLMKNFKQFLASRGVEAGNPTNSGDTEKLLGDFLLWQKQKR